MLLHRVVSFLAAALVILSCAYFAAQTAPSAPDRPWKSPYEQQIQTQNHNLPAPNFVVDPNKAYSLAELVDLAEQHDPQTRFAWERAKAQAAALGIARSEWYPVLGALASGEPGKVGKENVEMSIGGASDRRRHLRPSLDLHRIATVQARETPAANPATPARNLFPEPRCTPCRGNSENAPHFAHRQVR